MRRRLTLLAGALLLSTSCRGADESTTSIVPPTGSAPTSAAATTAPLATATTSVVVTTDPPSTNSEPGPITSTSTAATTVGPTTAPTRTIDAKVYLLRDERLVIAHRQIVPPAVLRAALSALLAGPTPSERAAGLTSAIPTGTRLLDVALAEDGLATIDFSGSYDDGGGTLSMQARLAEVVFTATQFPQVTGIALRLDGVPISTLGGEGLDVSVPQARAQMTRQITGAVLVDTPAPGATVGPTFTVTGESDAFEAEFPIEVWAGDTMIGGVTGVRGGAWGMWAAFETTITVDADAGPVQLVAYDPGGCGTEPECPVPVKTVVALIVAGTNG